MVKDVGEKKTLSVCVATTLKHFFGVTVSHAGFFTSNKTQVLTVTFSSLIDCTFLCLYTYRNEENAIFANAVTFKGSTTCKILFI